MIINHGMETKFVSKVTTSDGRLTSGKTYKGRITQAKTRAKSGTLERVTIIDDKGELMTFDPAAFR